MNELATNASTVIDVQSGRVIFETWNFLPAKRFRLRIWPEGASNPTDLPLTMVEARRLIWASSKVYSAAMGLDP